MQEREVNTYPERRAMCRLLYADSAPLDPQAYTGLEIFGCSNDRGGPNFLSTANVTPKKRQPTRKRGSEKSLAVQWLGLGTLTVGTLVQSLVRELRS